MRSRQRMFRVSAVVAAFAAATATFSAYATAGADTGIPAGGAAKSHAAPAKTNVGDDLAGPFSKQQDKLHQDALNQVLAGRKTVKKVSGSQVVKLADKKYVELGREKTDKIFTILAEFGDQVDDQYGGDVGPLHNQIAEPDRTKDNSTAWQADYNRAHFQDIYFGTGKDSDATKSIR